MKALMDHQGHAALFYEAVEGGHAGASTNAQKAYAVALTYQSAEKHSKNPATVTTIRGESLFVRQWAVCVDSRAY